MASTEWRTEIRNGGEEWFIVSLAELGFRIDDDGRASGAFLAAAAPFGGIVGGWPALAKGDSGFAPTVELSSFVELDADSPEPARFSITPIVEATDISGPVYGVDVALHRGQDGTPGTAVLDPTDYGTPVAGRLLAVNSAADGFELAVPKVGGLHFPASITSAPDGSTAEFTMAVISIPAGTYNFAWRPALRGNAIVTGSSADVKVDLVVRLDDETGGDIIGRGRGLVALQSQPNIISKPESGTGVVAAGAAATLYFRTKKMAGSGTYGASNADAAFEMQVVAVP